MRLLLKFNRKRKEKEKEEEKKKLKAEMESLERERKATLTTGAVVLEAVGEFFGRDFGPWVFEQ